MLPDKSQASLRKGIWFVHTEDLNSIKIFGSNFGKEQIYLNEKLVSENRSFKLKSEHQFKDENGNRYEIKFITSNALKGKMECQILKNGEKIKSFFTTYRKGKNFSLLRIAIFILLSAGFGFVKALLKLPPFSFFIFLSFILIIHFYTRDPGEIIIEEK